MRQFKRKYFLFITLLLIGSISLHAQVVKQATDTIQIGSKDTTGTPNRYGRIEVDAEFPGGLQAWATYLGTHLDADVPIRKRAPLGTYRVIIKFIVNKDGAVCDLESETSFGYGMEEEAIRVLRSSPLWIPAIQDGRHVNAYKRQPITFRVTK